MKGRHIDKREKMKEAGGRDNFNVRKSKKSTMVVKKESAKKMIRYSAPRDFVSSTTEATSIKTVGPAHVPLIPSRAYWSAPTNLTIKNQNTHIRKCFKKFKIIQEYS